MRSILSTATLKENRLASELLKTLKRGSKLCFTFHWPGFNLTSRLIETSPFVGPQTTLCVAGTWK